MKRDRIMFSIDRFESDFAVCISDDGETFKINKSVLPENAKEGSIIIVIDNNFVLDDSETKSRMNKIKKLQEKLWE